MSNLSENSTPWTFSQWQMQQSYADVHGISESAYIQYLKNWYKNKTKLPENNKQRLKQEYIQLLKDLNFLVGQNEKDLFIKDINYNNEEDLVLAIPYFAKKLTEIAKFITSKRESLKRAKNRFNLIGSNKGLESLMYDYVLRSFTQKEGQVVQIPALPIQNLFPALSAVKNDFFIELEELHDPTNYYDSDPSVDIKEYLDYSHLESFMPLMDENNPLSEQEIINLISTRFLNRASDSTLFNIFKDYLNNVSFNPTLSSLGAKINNQIKASYKYYGEPLYGLTALKIDELTTPDYVLQLNFQQGDNWFLWPSGYQELTHNTYNNTYSAISIQNSNLIYSGATPGIKYTEADIIFSDKNGTLEGAWLQGPYTVDRNGQIQITLKGGDSTEFLYPYVGYNLNSKSLYFDGFNFTRSNERFFDSLTTSQQQNILQKYYTSTLPYSAANPIYLNQTTLIDQGVTSGKFSDEADTLFKKTHDYTVPALQSGGDGESAFAYKFDRTDLPITVGDNNIIWPIQTFKENDILTVNFTEKDCLPVRLNDINPAYTMAGAVAGQAFDDADVIYKLNGRGDVTQATEVAWYGSEPVSHLNIHYKNIPIYGTMSAVDCAHMINGSIQSSLSFKASPTQKISFIWCGEDTYADDVFKYIEHEKNCEYGNSYPHDYYKDQDFINPVSLSDKNHWSKCTCGSVYYSPIGHSGTKVTDYNATADYLFADPFGIGDAFALKSWKDTRGLTIKDSPQFSYFQLDQKEGDGKVGFGTGRWKTSDSVLSEVGDRMILKTGRRYTYYRSGLRTNSNSSNGNTIAGKPSPYLVCNYIYPKLNAIMCDGKDVKYDIVLALDYSKSQSFNFDQIKIAAGEICKKLINACDHTNLNTCYDRSKNVQIAVVAFAAEGVIVNYLTNETYEINLQIQSLESPIEYPSFETNISNALKIADYILNNTSATAQIEYGLKDLCSNLNATIIKGSQMGRNLNIPQKGAIQKIIVISDGVSTTEDPQDIINLASTLKDKGIEIQTISMGELSLRRDLMEKISSSEQTHFNLYKYLVSGDGDYDRFIDYVSQRIGGCSPFYPTWRKAIKDANNVWRESRDVSEMILNPNDYLIFKHRSVHSYDDSYNGVKFSQPSVSFTINVKLDGWDYASSSFSPLNIGPSYGAKPFWAKIPNNPIPYAGQVRFVDEYLPVHQPEVSLMVLKQPSFVRYNRVGTGDIKWTQPINFTETINTVSWNKIILDNKKYSNLQSILRSNKKDWIVSGSYEPSDMLLESYSEYRPARYYYYAQNGFVYTENLYLKNRCFTNFVVFTSGKVLDPNEPYVNFSNKFFPTIATVSFPEMAVSEAEVGGYLLPENLGASTFRGRGYVYEVNQAALTALQAENYEQVFLDPQKYGTRNRGLTKKDQLSPTVLKNIDNKWIMEPYGSGAKAGVIIGAKENQKFTPYQSDYEVLGYNTHGLARQDDSFQFWNFDSDNNASWKQENSEVNYRKELNAGVYGDHVNKLLANKGTMVQWRCDIFGNDYGLYKQLPSEVIHIKKLPPSIVFQTASSMEINMSSYYVLSVEATGEQPFSYQWYKDNVPLRGGNLANYIIYKSVPATSGVYVCTVSNLMGAVSSYPIYISFNPLTEGNFITGEDDLDEILTGDDSKPISWV